MGAHNINLVTPTPYIPQICEAIDLVRGKIDIPFVYNTGGYEKVESIRLLKGYIDIYLTDIKYCSSIFSQKYSSACDYFENAIESTKEMIKQTGPPVFVNDGTMQSGVIIRHLVLPGLRHDSLDILSCLAENFGTESFLLSLMSQYTPNSHLDAFPELNRRITSFEYSSVTDAALTLGFLNAYTQEKSSADKKYTPPFDLSGV